MRRLGSSLFLVLALGGQVAVADDGVGHTYTTLPNFKLEGGPDKSSLDVGFDLIHGIDAVTDLRISPDFKATASDGVTTLLSTDGSSFKAGGSWQLGISATLTNLHPLGREPYELLGKTERAAGFMECSETCKTNPSDPFCKKLDVLQKEEQERVANLEQKAKDAATAAQDAETNHAADAADKRAQAEAARAMVERAKLAAPAVVFEQLSDADMCEAVLRPYLAANRDARLLLPESIWSAGFLVGQSRNKWLDPSSTDPMLYSVATKSYPLVTLAGAYTTISPKNSITKELRLRFDSSREASSKTAKWCTPAGMVTRPDGSGSDPAQVCDEQPLGAPTAVRTMRAAGYVGYVDPENAAWRFAMGVTLKYSPVSNGEDAYEIGGEMPIYARMSIIKDSLSTIVRIAPMFTFSHGSDGTDDATFTITLAVLGDRSLFANALE